MEIKSVKTQATRMTINERLVVESFGHTIEVELVFKKTAKSITYDIKPKTGQDFTFISCQNPALTQAVATAIFAAACRAEELIAQSKKADILHEADVQNKQEEEDPTPDKQRRETRWEHIDFSKKEPTIANGTVSMWTINAYKDMGLTAQQIFDDFKSNTDITLIAIEQMLDYIENI